MSVIKSLFFILLILTISSCKDGFYNNDSVINNSLPQPSTSIEIGESNNNMGRAIWQKPELVIEKLGDLSDKVIADIGAGSGYFSFKLAFNAKKVIAVEIDQQYLDFIDSTKTSLPTTNQDKIETRLATPTDPNLGEEEVDIILIINTVAYIDDLAAYFTTIKPSLKEGGKIMIIDYKMKRLPINAPPKTERIYLDVVEDKLIQTGYLIEQTDDTSLDYQYIIQATKQ